MRFVQHFFIQISTVAVSICETVNGENILSGLKRFTRRRRRGLILYGRALGLGHGEAEDVLQETFLALMQIAGISARAGALLRPQFPEPRAESQTLALAAADAGTGIAALV